MTPHLTADPYAMAAVGIVVLWSVFKFFEPKGDEPIP